MESAFQRRHVPHTRAKKWSGFFRKGFLCIPSNAAFFKGINASSLSLTAFTVERYIAICHPMKAKSICTVKRAKKIIVGVWIFAFCYSSPWLGLTTTEPIMYKGHQQAVEMCTFKLSRQEYLVCWQSIWNEILICINLEE